MTAQGRRGEDATLTTLAWLARRVATTPVDPELDRAGRARVLYDVRRELERPARRVLVPVAVVTALVAAVALAAYALWPRPLSYEVRGARLDGPYVSAGTAPVGIEFSDGSAASAAPGSRLRVERTTWRGARVLVERGHVSVDVGRFGSARFAFLAGPFEVRVAGARFELDWDPALEVLEVDLLDGSIEVEGPLGGAVSVRAGQRFRAELDARRMTVVDADEVYAPVEFPVSPALEP